MQKPSFILGAALLLLAVSPALASGEWEELQGCRLIEHEANDGDSFHVDVDGEERIFRLYFVDAPESEDGGRGAERITDQAETFGITEEESIEIGKKAAAFTSAVLSRPFTVLTRGQNAMGASKLKREYAFVTTADGEDLGELLVSRGLARSFGHAGGLFLRWFRGLMC
jgi:endonuclease YncB( thermonuclease family)